MPNRQEGITIEMVEYFIDIAKYDHPDSFSSALADWMILGLQGGFCLTEYAQDSSRIFLPISSAITKNIDGTAKAFLHSDFTFYGKHRRPITKYSISSIITI